MSCGRTIRSVRPLRQALAYVYARETKQQVEIAKVLTFDEARRIAVNFATLSGLLATGLKAEEA